MVLWKCPILPRIKKLDQTTKQKIQFKLFDWSQRFDQALYQRSLMFFTQDSDYDLVTRSILKKDTLLKSRIYMPTNIIREKSISLKLCVGIPRVFKVWTHAEIPTSKNYILKSYLRYLFQTPQLLLLSMQRPARFITSQRLFYIVSGKKDFF